jgi:hypothetical protein
MRGSPFFDGVAQVELEIAGERALVPVFYYDTAAMTALFPARFRELRRLMPDRRFVPALLAPGVGVLAVSCLEHRETGIGPYGELAISVPLNEPWFRPNLPGRALLEGARRRQLHAFMLHLPVTTELALRGGIDFYNFPKFLAGIEFDEDGGLRRCRLGEGKEQILSFSGERLRTRPPTQAEAQYFFHLWMDRQPQQAEFKLNRLEAATSMRPGAAMLDLSGRHPIAIELERLLFSRRSLQYEYVPRLEAILYGPEHLTLPLLTRSLAAVEEAATSSASERVRRL